jgi:hypothetical protein
MKLARLGDRTKATLAAASGGLLLANSNKVNDIIAHSAERRWSASRVSFGSNPPAGDFSRMWRVITALCLTGIDMRWLELGFFEQRLVTRQIGKHGESATLLTAC